MIKVKIRKENIKTKTTHAAPKNNLIDFMLFLQNKKIQLTAIEPICFNLSIIKKIVFFH